MSDLGSWNSLWSRFTAKAELVGAVVTRTGSQNTASSVLRVAAAEIGCTSSVAARFPRVASSLAARTTKATASFARAGRPTVEVVSVAEFAVAETGSIALNEPASDRGACFLSERLLVLVAERDIVDTLEHGIQRMHDLLAPARGTPCSHPTLPTALPRGPRGRAPAEQPAGVSTRLASDP